MQAFHVLCLALIFSLWALGDEKTNLEQWWRLTAFRVGLLAGLLSGSEDPRYHISAGPSAVVAMGLCPVNFHDLTPYCPRGSLRGNWAAQSVLHPCI